MFLGRQVGYEVIDTIPNLCDIYNLFCADSTWSRFFRNAELEKMVDQDLSRLYPEQGSYFQTSGCQGMLRRILLLWCLRHPEYGYRQGELLLSKQYFCQLKHYRSNISEPSLNYLQLSFSLWCLT